MSASDIADIGTAAPVADVGEEARLRAKRRDRIISVASPLGLLLAWELAAQAALIDVRFFPAPSSILVTLIDTARAGELVENVRITLERIVLGFLLGGVPAIVI